jgi:hypothetical protein
MEPKAITPRQCRTCGREMRVYRTGQRCVPCKQQRAALDTRLRTCYHCGRDGTQTIMRVGRNCCNNCHAARERARTLGLRKGPPLCPVCETNPVAKHHDGMCLACYAVADEFDVMAESCAL